MDDFAGWLGQQSSILTTIFLSILGLIVAVYFARNPKRLDYAIGDFTRLLAGGARQVRSTVSFRVGDRELVDPYVVTLRVRNTGTKAVRREDFDEEISIECAGGGLIEAYVVRASVSKLEKLVVSVSNRGGPDELGIATVSKSLINPGDWFDVQLLFANAPRGVRARSRIADASPMKRLNMMTLLEPPTRTKRFVFAFWFILALGVALFLVATSEFPPTGPMLLVVPAGALFVGVFASFSFSNTVHGRFHGRDYWGNRRGDATDTPHQE